MTYEHLDKIEELLGVEIPLASKYFSESAGVIFRRIYKDKRAAFATLDKRLVIDKFVMRVSGRDFVSTIKIDILEIIFEFDLSVDDLDGIDLIEFETATVYYKDNTRDRSRLSFEPLARTPKTTLNVKFTIKL